MQFDSEILSQVTVFRSKGNKNSIFWNPVETWKRWKCPIIYHLSIERNSGLFVYICSPPWCCLWRSGPRSRHPRISAACRKCSVRPSERGIRWATAPPGTRTYPKSLPSPCRCYTHRRGRQCAWNSSPHTGHFRTILYFATAIIHSFCSS